MLGKCSTIEWYPTFDPQHYEKKKKLVISSWGCAILKFISKYNVVFVPIFQTIFPTSPKHSLLPDLL
jgi:hypothetical protein